ncbi:MAG TPA: LysR family transcriptional regulator [Geobacteraceae bacterium]
METVYLKTLVVAARTGSFSKAAAQLCITQSAVSQRVKFLEDRYGYQLLDRSGPLLIPTDIGAIVLEKAERILLIEKELDERLKHVGGKIRLSLCCTPTFGIAYLPQVLNSFIAHNADVVDLKFMLYSPEQAIKGLHDNECDLGIIEHCENLELAEFQTFELPRDELIFISSPNLNLLTTEIDLATLMQQRFIARKEGCSSRRLLTRNLAAMGRNLSDFRSMIIYDDLRLTIDTVLEGSGIAYVSKSLVSKHLDEGTLCAHHVNGFCSSRLRTLALNKNSHVERTLQNFIDCVYMPFDLSPPVIVKSSCT